MLTDLAVAVADGADPISGIEVLADREELFGQVASMSTTWRVLDRLDEDHLEPVRAARAVAGEAAWAAGARPDRSQELRLDFDATITIAHSEKQNSAATWKKTFGYHPLSCFLDRPEIAADEDLAGLLRPGNAGSNTAAGHGTVLDQALAALPQQAQPRPGDPNCPRLLARSDSADATHTFAAVCVDRGWEFSFGFPIDMRIQRAVDAIPEQCWHPALNGDDDLRDGAWVAEIPPQAGGAPTGTANLDSWPPGSRLVLRKERPHPGAQLWFIDVDGHRITAFLTNTPPGVIPGQVAGLELRHRRHARVEARIRQSKATGLRNLPEVVLSPPGLQGVDLHVCVMDGVVDVVLGGGGLARADDFRGSLPGRVAA